MTDDQPRLRMLVDVDRRHSFTCKTACHLDLGIVLLFAPCEPLTFADRDRIKVSIVNAVDSSTNGQEIVSWSTTIRTNDVEWVLADTSIQPTLCERSKKIAVTMGTLAVRAVDVDLQCNIRRCQKPDVIELESCSLFIKKTARCYALAKSLC